MLIYSLTRGIVNEPVVVSEYKILKDRERVTGLALSDSLPALIFFLTLYELFRCPIYSSVSLLRNVHMQMLRDQGEHWQLFSRVWF